MKKVSLLVFGILLLSDFAFGDVSTNNNAQGILEIFSSNASAWISSIIPYAKSLFWYLVVADWVWTFGLMALKGTDFNEIMAGVIQKVLIIGFFMIMFQYTSWLDTIPQSFGQMANSISGVSIQPDTILEQGYGIVAKIWEGTSWFDSPGDSLGLMIAGVIILMAYIVMTAMLFMVLVKLYLLIVGAYFMLALGGFGYTRTMGVTAIIAVFKAGLELFFLKLLLGISLSVINQMAANVGTDNNSVMAMIGTSILIAYLTTMVSGLVESLTNGTLGGNSNLAGSVKNSMQGAAQGAMGGAIGAASGVAAAKAAAELSQAASVTGTSMGNSGTERGNSTGKMGNFMNNAKTTVAGVSGGVAGAASGALKGMIGIGTYNAGQKSGSTVGKVIGGSNAKTATPGIDTNKQQKDNLTSGSIYPGSSQKEDANDNNSTYLSAIPGEKNE
ncbi:MAG: P-type conjugative transfer protein TrbL [Sulfurovum sp.]|nr:P-type conjugative transfer protein TrbL [Sulfurovum sp.]